MSENVDEMAKMLGYGTRKLYVRSVQQINRNIIN